MLSPRGRFRRAIVERGRGGVRINLPQDRGHAGHRAVPFGEGRPPLVLLLGSRSRVSGTSDGLSPHHGDDVAPPPAQDDVLRSPLPQPAHAAPPRAGRASGGPVRQPRRRGGCDAGSTPPARGPILVPLRGTLAYRGRSHSFAA